MRNILKTISSILIIPYFFAVAAFAAENVTFYHTDPAGTPIAMTDASGNVVWRADYRPFGEEQSITGTIENNKRFAGKEKDEETGLYYFGARYMRSEIGRFITVDPVGPVDPWTSKTNEKMLLNPQKLNRYAYGLNNPYRYIDPDGKAAIEIKHFLETRQQLLGWTPPWLQEFLMPVDVSISPMAIGSAERKIIEKSLKEIAGEGLRIRWDKNTLILKDTITGKIIKIQGIPNGMGDPSTWKEITEDVSTEMLKHKEIQKVYEQLKSSSEATDLLDAIETILKKKKSE